MSDPRPAPPPVVLAAPSGTGKTTIAHRLVEGPGNFVFSVSATTRDPRPGEVDGVDYDFVTREVFEAMIRDGALAEWAEVHGRYYGTPVKNLDGARSRGACPLLDIDVQGARQIRERVPEAVLVFILPPSGSTLLERLGGRGTEDGAAVRRRLRTARDELEAVPEFDYVVVNDDLDRAVEQIRTIIEAERSRTDRFPDLEGRVRGLIEEIDGANGPSGLR